MSYMYLRSDNGWPLCKSSYNNKYNDELGWDGSLVDRNHMSSLMEIFQSEAPTGIPIYVGWPKATSVYRKM